MSQELQACTKKLANPGFVQRAPAEVVAEQRSRQAHYAAAQKALED